MASKLLNLFALTTLAIFASSFGSVQVNAASLSSNHHARSFANHALIAKKRGAGDRPKCKSRPSSSSAAPAGQATGGSSNSGGSSSGQPTTAPPAYNSNGKAMVVWGAGYSPERLRNFHVGQVSTIYNWSPNEVEGAAAAGYEYVPMLWGIRDVEYVRNNIKPGQYKNILGFNEPDHADQSAIDPYYAADVWKDVMVPLRNGGTRLISPAVTNGPSGPIWFEKFLQRCGGIEACGIDAIAVHVYATDIEYVKNYISSWTKYNRPIWLTEFACTDFAGGAQPSYGQVLEFASQMGAWLKSQPFIEKYAPFMVADDLLNVVPENKLVNGNGLSEVATKYFY